MTEDDARKKLKLSKRSVRVGIDSMAMIREKVIRLYRFHFFLLLNYGFLVILANYGIDDLLSMASYLICCMMVVILFLKSMFYYRKKYTHEYLVLFFRVRSNLDQIVSLVDSTVFRKHRIRHRYKESVVRLIAAFDCEAGNRWSPLKWYSGIQLSIRFAFFTYIIILYTLLLLICYERYISVPWHYQFW